MLPAEDLLVYLVCTCCRISITFWSLQCFFVFFQNFTGTIKIDYPTYICKVKIVFRHHVSCQQNIFLHTLQSSDFVKSFFFDERELPPWLSNLSIERGCRVICRHDPSQTLGVTKVLFFKACPVHLLQRVCGCSSREGGKLLRPRSPCAPLPVACLLGSSPLRVSYPRPV